MISSLVALAEAGAGTDIAQAVLVLCMVASAGLALGALRYRGVGLGTAGVLFSGILFGHFGWTMDPVILEFLREFGLILFVFCIGLQLGPGFFASLRRDGIKMNALAVSTVVAGMAVVVLTGWLLGIVPGASLGIFSGATTNTPSLGAIQGTLDSMGAAGAAARGIPALAYAVAYPAGIFGVIAALLITRAVFRIDAEAEAAEVEAEQRRQSEPLQRMNLIIQNPNLEGLRLAELPGRVEMQISISRARRRDESEVHAAQPDFIARAGDVLLVVGAKADLERFRQIVGRKTDEDLMQQPSDAIFQRVVVTQAAVLGKSIEELGLEHHFGVIATRVIRGETEMPANRGLRLQFGDVLHLVGTPQHVAAAAGMVGNSIRALNETQFLPIFVGIALGVLAGTKAFSIPGLPVPLRLGLAGGPLVLAIMLARLGHFGRLVWHMPPNANRAFRELGMTLFLACVGLKAGSQFFASVFTRDGLLWLASAMATSLVPLLIVAFVARKVMKMKFPAIAGVLAGSTTDPPALAFASAICKSDAPAVTYATVYPLAMLLRIIAAQVLTLLLLH